jgi:hypothetical protein
MMFIPHRKHAYEPPRSVTEMASHLEHMRTSKPVGQITSNLLAARCQPNWQSCLQDVSPTGSHVSKMSARLAVMSPRCQLNWQSCLQDVSSTGSHVSTMYYSNALLHFKPSRFTSLITLTYRSSTLHIAQTIQRNL